MSSAKPWKLRLVCCGRDAGEEFFSTWGEADAFRESYTNGPGVGSNGHDRAAILERT